MKHCVAVPQKWWEGLDDDMPGSHTSDAIAITLKYAALVQGSRRFSATCSISWRMVWAPFGIVSWGAPDHVLMQAMAEL